MTIFKAMDSDTSKTLDTPNTVDNISTPKEEKAVIPIEELLPKKINLIPLNGRPIYPGIFTPLLINDADDIRSVEEAYGSTGFIGLSL